VITNAYFPPVLHFCDGGGLSNVHRHEAVIVGLNNIGLKKLSMLEISFPKGYRELNSRFLFLKLFSKAIFKK